MAGGAAYLGDAVSGRQSALYLIGGALGISLYHALFGFTGAYRRLLSDGRGSGVRAQLIMLALASLIFAPLLRTGSVFGQQLSGTLASIGVSVMVGAFIFGVGMQLGGGCASGTLFTVGGGSTRMTITLIAFIAGSLAGSAHLPWWLGQPKLEAISLYNEIGWPGGLTLQLAFIAALALLTIRIERKRHGALEPAEKPANVADALHRLLFGRWPLLWGAVALAFLNVATLLVAGRPALGHYLGKYAVGRQGGGRCRAEHCRLVFFGNGLSGARPQQRRHSGHHLGDECRYPCRRWARGISGRALCPDAQNSAALDCRRADRRAAARLWRAPRLRLQYRRLFQRRCVGQPAWLGMAGVWLPRHGCRDLSAAAVWLYRKR